MPSPEYIAVILCGTAGARMFPLSVEQFSSLDDFYDKNPSDSDADDDNDNEKNEKDLDEKELNKEATKEEVEDEYRPKYLLPVAGIPILHRLLFNVQHAGFEKCIIACSAMDKRVTLTSVERICTPLDVTNYSETGKATLVLKSKPENKVQFTKQSTKTSPSGMNITLLDLPSNCDGSCIVLQYVAKQALVDHPLSHVVVMPSDLILDNSNANKNSDVLGSLVGTHRRGYEDKNGMRITIKIQMNGMYMMQYLSMYTFSEHVL